MTDQPWWHSAGEPPPENLGSAAEEAARLFTAMRDRFLADPAALRAGARLMDSFASVRGVTNPVPPGDAPECAYCPVCQAIARAKSLNPETVERLTGAAMEFAETVRHIVGSPGAADDDRVRHVPLDDDFEGWPEPQDAPPGPASMAEQDGRPVDGLAEPDPPAAEDSDIGAQQESIGDDQ